ncbi:MAG TPA: glycosyltransferase family 4 protein [Thermoplasmata archaeon]|nr:glycosyltransferase family 4 protein [Thermoplasmata archaeon]
MTNVLRVAFFTDTFPPMRDGVAQVADALAGTLRRHGHEVTVFTVQPKGLSRWESRPDGTRVHRHRSLPAPGYPQYRIALFPFGPAIAPGFRQRFDIVHVHTPGFVGLAGWLAARGAGTPVVGTYHTDLLGMLRGAARSRAGQSGPGAPRQNLSTSTPFSTSLGARGNGPRAVERRDSRAAFVGVVGGEGPQSEQVAARLADPTRFPCPVRYIGGVPEEEKPALLAQTAVFVLPSLSDTSSVALLEAMASGAACVVTRRGGPAEIARRSNAGILVDPEDPSEIRGAIEGLLSQPSRARELGQRARAWVQENAPIGRTAQAFLALYEDLLDERDRADRTGSLTG